VRDQFLTNLDPKQSLSLEALNDRLWTWIEHAYHRAEHSALGSTPLLRWQRDIEHVRQLPPATDLRRLFFYRLDRLVRRDCTFLLHNRFYEAPPHLPGETIEVRFDPLDAAEVEIYFQGKPQGTARLVDPVINAQLTSPKRPAKIARSCWYATPTTPRPPPQDGPNGVRGTDRPVFGGTRLRGSGDQTTVDSLQPAG